MDKIGISGSHGFIGSALMKKIGGQAIDRSGNCSQYDVVFDLAAYGCQHDQTDPFLTYEANVLRLIKMFQTAKCKSFVMVSTSVVKFKNQTFYSASKLASENIVKLWVEQFGLPIKIVRPYSVYGPNEREDRFIPTIIRSLKNKLTLKLVDGVHDWIYIDDFIDALILVAEKGTPGNVYEIGTGIQSSNMQVVETLEKIANKKLEIINKDNNFRYDNGLWQANTKEINRLGWYPKYDLNQGLIQCWKKE